MNWTARTARGKGDARALTRGLIRIDSRASSLWLDLPSLGHQPPATP